MGSQVTAMCECGLEESISIGGGMMNFMTTCYFPCFCEHCCNVVQVNILTKRNRCPKCKTKVVPYDDPALSEIAGDQIIASLGAEERIGRALILTNTNYRCPRCRKVSLRFEDSGICFD